MVIRSLAFFLSLLFLIPQNLVAQTQVVSPSELREAMSVAARARQKNRADVQAFFSSEPARSALKAGNIDPERVQKAVATLSPEELARLAARTSQLQQDFAAGALTNQEITYVLIALAAAVFVLIVVAA